MFAASEAQAAGRGGVSAVQRATGIARSTIDRGLREPAVAPYGIYDIAANAGWINLGITHDTAAFAVESIRRWWHGCGSTRYPNATKLLITADCGGSNGARLRLWKRELQVLADELGIAISVCHHPPGTSSRVDDWRGGGRSRM